mmetsp:Transcript_61101/g.90640  ORF Transcript_61101/g.90640 Transcript_61101/m.90640 type:complete len:576 (-) Transcript_61101:392-2119(-)
MIRLVLAESADAYGLRVGRPPIPRSSQKSSLFNLLLKMVLSQQQRPQEQSYQLKQNPFSTMLSNFPFLQESMCIVIIGASGDLAKKKTYPSLLKLYEDNLLPSDTIIWGYARSKKTHESLRAHLKPYLVKVCGSELVVDGFLSRCYYQSGSSYGDIEAYGAMMKEAEAMESSFINPNDGQKRRCNRLFYLAIPPNVFGDAGTAIKETAMSISGWNRLIIEKPFGRDLESCDLLSKQLTGLFEEHHLYRIDHYLGKEMVQNLLIFRFGNAWLEWMWNRNAIKAVILTFKEPFGTEGRGGYFDQYGIIRDIMQNHLLQVLTLLAMEPPIEADGPTAADHVRDAKVQVLRAMSTLTLDDCLLGQYRGYADDETITNKQTNTPTYAAIHCKINTPRWSGVPFIMKAGKALNERKCEARIILRDAPGSSFLFPNRPQLPPNEIVLRLQPNPTVYIKTNIKHPGFDSQPVQSSMDMSYSSKFDMAKDYNNPDAYTRLLLDVMRGRQASFVRDDELRRSWEIFTPLLHKIENEDIMPVLYEQDSRGPAVADDFVEEKTGYVHNPGSLPGVEKHLQNIQLSAL